MGLSVVSFPAVVCKLWKRPKHSVSIIIAVPARISEQSPWPLSHADYWTGALFGSQDQGTQ